MSTALVGQRVPDLDDPETFTSGVPYEFLAELRATEGLYWQETRHAGYPGGGFWVVTRHADIVALEGDPSTFTSTRGYVPRMMSPETTDFNVGTIMQTDPPEHSRLRRIVSKSFAPRVVANFERWIRDIIVEALDEAVALGEFDFVQVVAAKVPARVIAKVVGVPDTRREDIVLWTNQIFDASVDLANPENLQLLGVIMNTIMDYTVQLRDDKLLNPSDDVISVLGALVRDGELTELEFRQFTQTFINAGFETTHTTMGQSVRMLAENPTIAEKFGAVMAAEGSRPLVDEFLRLVTPVMTFCRTATRDVEFSGTLIREGDAVSVWYPAANRDPNVFENPDEFVPGRANAANHMAFGTGPHRCLGMALARLQVGILLEEIHRRGLKFEIAGTPRRGYSSFINQLRYLPLTVVAQAG
jgi:cytochrome P450